MIAMFTSSIFKVSLILNTEFCESVLMTLENF